jgi:hypothetical protein
MSSIGDILSLATAGVLMDTAGNITVPSASDVRQGVSYGEDGTQYVGLLTEENFDQETQPIYPFQGETIFLSSNITMVIYLSSKL